MSGEIQNIPYIQAELKNGSRDANPAQQMTISLVNAYTMG